MDFGRGAEIVLGSGSQARILLKVQHEEHREWILLLVVIPLDAFDCGVVYQADDSLGYLLNLALRQIE